MNLHRLGCDLCSPRRPRRPACGAGRRCDCGTGGGAGRARGRRSGRVRPMRTAAELAALEEAGRGAARVRRRRGGPSRAPPPLAGRFLEGGWRFFRDGAELHLVPFGLADADPAWDDGPEYVTDVLGGAPPGPTEERGSELATGTGDAPMQ